MSVEIDALSRIVVSPIEEVMGMIVPDEDGLTLWRVKILALTMVFVRY